MRKNFVLRSKREHEIVSDTGLLKIRKRKVPLLDSAGSEAGDDLVSSDVSRACLEEYDRTVDNHNLEQIK